MWCGSHDMPSPTASAALKRYAAYTSDRLQCADGTVQILLGQPFLFCFASGVGYYHSAPGMISRISWDGQRANEPYNIRRTRSDSA